MPGALVPARRSSQLLPSTKPMLSARRSTLGVPHTQSSWPAASETAMTASQSRAAWPSTSSSSGKTRGERVGLTVVAQGVGGQRDRRLDPVDLDPRRGRAHPGVGHVGAHTAALDRLRRRCHDAIVHTRRAGPTVPMASGLFRVCAEGVVKSPNEAHHEGTCRGPPRAARGPATAPREEPRCRCHDEPPSFPTACPCSHGAGTAAPARAPASWRWPPSSPASDGATTRRARTRCSPRWPGASTTCSTTRAASGSAR